MALAQDYDLSHFKERFEIKLNEKGEKTIVDKTLLQDLSMDIYIKNLATYLTAEESDQPEVTPDCKGYEYEKPNPDLMKSFQKAFEWMKKTNIGALLVNEKFLKFINDVEIESDKYTKDPQFVVVANLDNPSYFYDKAFMKFLKDKVGDLAKGYFNATIFLKVVTYIGDDYSGFIARKKLYHQNILSYYLETIPAEELGLTEVEKNKALSSIIDSRLSFGFGGYWEHRKVKKDFEGYGYKKFLSDDKKAEKRWEKYSDEFDGRLSKINHNFSEVSFDGNPMVVNLGDKKERLDDQPSLAFDSECPDFLYLSRRRFELIKIALGMSPIPYSSKLFYLVKSKYQSQALNEGYYYGYLESTNQLDKKEHVLKQSMNPLLINE
jgi:hypothetical protein